MILVGRIGSSIEQSYIKHYLYISDKENLRDRISQFSSHISMQYMLDLIFSCIFRMDYKKNMDYINEVIGFIDDRNINDEK